MKIGEATLKSVMEYVRAGPDAAEEIGIIADAAKALIRSHTGLDDEGMDQHEDLTIAFLVLCADMYDNRAMTVQTDKENPVVTQILSLHAGNLL